MSGGGDKTIPIYNIDATDPNVPNEQRELMHPRGPPPQQPQPFITLQVAQPPKPKTTIPQPFQYLPNMTAYPQAPQLPQFSGYGAYNAPTNIVNQIVIGEQNPYQDHKYIHMIYEDVLPLKHLPNSLNTIGERLTLFNFIKSMVLQGRDGTTIPFRNGTNNLFDKLKATELNPYRGTDNTLKANPYTSLPTNMLIYRSCYPIKRADNSVNAVVCAKDSIGMNLRLYRLTRGEMMINRQSDTDVLNSEVWREIMYYEYVRENIIRKKQSPHFVTMIGYSLCNDSEINFDKIEQLKNHEPIIMPQKTILNTSTGYAGINPNAYGNDILTAFTESPTYSLIQWATKAYANVGKSKRMINMGYHPDNVWVSIIFQIMVGMDALLQHGIYINDFNLRDNIYIKDLSGMSNITGYWKYIIDGISYYIPNYGYLVMIDSKYKDLPPPNTTIGQQQLPQHKIIGTLFNDQPNSDTYHTEITRMIVDSFINTINMNNFDNVFVQNGGIAPSDNARQIIDTVNKHAISMLNTSHPKDIIRRCIRQCMVRFMNNRIGTIVTKQEYDDMNKISKNFTLGDIVIYEAEPNLYKYAMYIGIDDNTTYIMTKENGGSDDFANIQMPIGNLYEISKIQPLRQNYKPNESKLDESDLLETYVC